MRSIMDLLRPPSARVMMVRELDEAERSLVTALSDLDHAECTVKYHEQRIERLRLTLEASHSESYPAGGTE